ELMADYAATPYAVHAAFALAKLSVERGELAPAAQSLQWILDHTGGDDAVLRHIARLRLASVLLAQNQPERAIELLRRPVDATTGFTARYDELRGDAHLQSGDSDAARDAYRRGLDALSADSIGHFLLKLKLDNLGG
ncbi:MAG: tetratricopeptide repeat protein, partial [Gammaproteobacteria bacterium]|nr:tetratricopeptide repeat protein [Gammaproteobacteria bacterium]